MAAIAVVPLPMNGSNIVIFLSHLIQCIILSGKSKGYGAGCSVFFSKFIFHTSFLYFVSCFLSNFGLLYFVNQYISSVLGIYLLLLTFCVEGLSHIISCLILNFVLNNHWYGDIISPFPLYILFL